ncbi:hypothetical protein HPP92_012209 [Vanilla planifolia]|uniref:Uncharacterized protein n=1 Tax=Vanilla planifolia TaxID=51239 RepID=A0A835R249_VANPL|nr:hypothetical protein HPP92_012209 [Vanilla planifolia]
MRRKASSPSPGNLIRTLSARSSVPRLAKPSSIFRKSRIILLLLLLLLLLVFLLLLLLLHQFLHVKRKLLLNLKRFRIQFRIRILTIIQCLGPTSQHVYVVLAVDPKLVRAIANSFSSRSFQLAGSIDLPCPREGDLKLL